MEVTQNPLTRNSHCLLLGAHLGTLSQHWNSMTSSLGACNLLLHFIASVGHVSVSINTEGLQGPSLLHPCPAKPRWHPDITNEGFREPCGRGDKKNVRARGDGGH
ncbi:hypothetical protein LEMLEM_LOCUS4878 [Lemmus lemmus]